VTIASDKTVPLLLIFQTINVTITIMKNPMIIISTIVGAVLLALVIGRINLSVQFAGEVKDLFSQSNNISEKIFHYQQLAGLPEPVIRYFKHTLSDGQPYISFARITHDGQFKTGLDKSWINIKGEQYATTQKPGFIWKGVTTMFTARDMYIGDKGRLVVSLFSLLKVADGKSEQYNQGELLRWLGESVLYPTNLLPGERLQWRPIDSQSAKLTFDYNGLSLFFVMSFNEVGEIIRMETKRYMDDTIMATWIIKIADYKVLNGVKIPTYFDVMWRLEKGDFSYAKFNIKKVEYDKAEIFN
jgi:hypothetical protein